MTVFVGLRSKTYTLRVEDKVTKKKSKEIKKCAIEKIISFDDYKDCLFNKK